MGGGGREALAHTDFKYVQMKAGAAEMKSDTRTSSLMAWNAVAKGTN
jgi:hypothetical protein